MIFDINNYSASIDALNEQEIKEILEADNFKPLLRFEN